MRTPQASAGRPLRTQASRRLPAARRTRSRSSSTSGQLFAKDDEPPRQDSKRPDHGQEKYVCHIRHTSRILMHPILVGAVSNGRQERLALRKKCVKTWPTKTSKQESGQRGNLPPTITIPGSSQPTPRTDSLTPCSVSR